MSYIRTHYFPRCGLPHIAVQCADVKVVHLLYIVVDGAKILERFVARSVEANNLRELELSKRIYSFIKTGGNSSLFTVNGEYSMALTEKIKNISSVFSIFTVYGRKSQILFELY